MLSGQNQADAFVTEDQDDRLHAILEYAVDDWSVEHTVGAETVKSLIMQISRIMNQSLFTGDGKTHREIAKLAVDELCQNVLALPPAASR